MKIIVISNPLRHENEIETIIPLFEEGLENLHIRKPRYSTRELSDFISKIPKKFMNNIIIHSHHELAVKFNLKGIHFTKMHRKNTIKSWIRLKLLKVKKPDLIVSTSIHNLEDVYNNKFNIKFDYIFLSPVFGSISKRGYESGFNENQLKEALKNSKDNVIALGGVNVENINKIKSIGFNGLAVLGAIWKSDSPVEQFIKIKEKASMPELNVKQITKKRNL